MDVQKLADTLHPLERTVLPLVKAHASPEALCAASTLKEIEVLRALQWLQNKGLVLVTVTENEVVVLEKNGRDYRKCGLPERRFLQVLTPVPSPLPKIIGKAGLSREEANLSIGLLRSKAAIAIVKQKELMVSLTDAGAKLQGKTLLEESFLEGEFPRPVKTLKDEERAALETLKKRREFLRVEKVKSRVVQITPLGETLLQRGIGAGKVIDTLTPEVLRNKEWKSKSFRRYDVKASVPRITGGRRHFVEEAIYNIRRIWLEMGFQEMQGSMVQTAFWDLDALFVPQDHPAREMQDTFFLKQKGVLPAALAKKVRATHENGGTTGSTGWGGQWSEEIARQVLLRTHTTVLSAQTIANLKESDLPAKFFSIARVFRNETLDWKHLFEFHQVEGIVVDPDANLRQLIGYLREFYKKMGYDDVRVRPSHFPYTEPSVEIEALHPIRKEWVELGGAGIFRPEVVEPLFGKDVPVLAWGQGMERIITEYYKLDDLRAMYGNDIEQLRTMRAWMR